MRQALATRPLQGAVEAAEQVVEADLGTPLLLDLQFVPDFAQRVQQQVGSEIGTLFLMRGPGVDGP